MTIARPRAAGCGQWLARRFRQLIIGLGWLGCGLVLLGWLGHLLPLELADHGVRTGCYSGATGLLLLWPWALYLQWRPPLRKWQRWVAVGLTLPFSWLLLFRVVVGPDQCIFEKVLLRQSDGAYIAQQTVYRTRENWGGRLVRVRPLGLSWQLVTAADTNALPRAEQRRLRRVQQGLRRHKRR